MQPVKVLMKKRKCILIAVPVCFGLFVIYMAVSSFLHDVHTNRKVSGVKGEQKVSTMERSIENHLRDEKEDVQDTRPERRDWNNYSLMERDSTRTGHGEQGAGVKLDLNSEEEAQRQKLKDKYRHDAYLSDRVSLERSIGDLRPEACKNVTYIKDIPENSVSVIIPMFNEKNSTLLRSIHSIINRSPTSLLKEVIVVDDFSQEEELKAPLDDYVREHFSNVKIVRNKQREGLIRSRIIGADASTGSFLVFLESHMEVNYNYLPPLLELVALDYRTIVCPTVDFIEDDFMIKITEKRTRGGFSWKLNYHRLPMNVQMDDTTPHNNPIMVGCAFAISRKWWEEFGKYDPGMELWGAEQFELSVKSWLCGGRVVDSPCSRVAHQFRNWPYVLNMLKAVNKNYARFAAVWMDGYREVVSENRPGFRYIHPGSDVVKRVEMRRRLKCKPFDWFLTEVAPDILEHFPIAEPPPLATGHLMLRSNFFLCASVKNKNTYLVNCNSNRTSVFTYDWRQRILRDEAHCFNSVLPNYLINGRCHDISPGKFQSFSWDTISGQIISYNTRLCLDSKPENLQLFLADCDVNKSSQSWTFEYFDGSRVDEEWNKFRTSLL